MTTEPPAPAAAEAVLSFWFGPPGPDGRPDVGQRKRWFTKDDAFDAALRERFLATHAEVVARGHEDWLATARGRLAYVIVLDQLSRNMFRGTPGMFIHDVQAREAAVAGIDRGDDARLSFDERAFLYMPLMHSENLVEQERSVTLFLARRDAAPPGLESDAENNVRFARMHRDIVLRFGRFPHRNATLGRSSTPAEEAFLEQSGSSF